MQSTETEEDTRLPVGQIAGKHIGSLQSRYRRDQAAAVAELARLRRGTGKPAYGESDGGGSEALEELNATTAAQSPTVRYARHGRPRLDQAEDALYLALTLWALHQQSIRDKNMHLPGARLGAAVRKLAGTPSSGDAMAEMSTGLRSRFTRLGTSTSLESLAVRLREIVVLLHGAEIPLDYAQLAEDLFRWQDPRRRADVRRSWVMSFHRNPPKTEESEAPAEPAATRIHPDESTHGATR